MSLAKLDKVLVCHFPIIKLSNVTRQKNSGTVVNSFVRRARSSDSPLKAYFFMEIFKDVEQAPLLRISDNG